MGNVRDKTICVAAAADCVLGLSTARFKEQAARAIFEFAFVFVACSSHRTAGEEGNIPRERPILGSYNTYEYQTGHCLSAICTYNLITVEIYVHLLLDREDKIRDWSQVIITQNSTNIGKT